MAATAIAIMGGLLISGSIRLSTPLPATTGPLIRIVQPNVPQETKYDEKSFSGIVDRYVRLTAKPARVIPDIVIWPEGAIPAAFEDYLARDTWTYDAISGALAPGQTLILGGYRYGQGNRDTASIFNSQAVIRQTRGGLKVLALYDKYRLVPFGEFMPLDGIASKVGLKALVHVGDGFTAGQRPAPVAVPGLPIMQPLICYEALYSGFTRRRRGTQRQARGVDRQHLQRRLVRDRHRSVAAPQPRQLPGDRRRFADGSRHADGISGVIDPYGRLIPRESLV